MAGTMRFCLPAFRSTAEGFGRGTRWMVAGTANRWWKALLAQQRPPGLGRRPPTGHGSSRPYSIRCFTAFSPPGGKCDRSFPRRSRFCSHINARASRTPEVSAVMVRTCIAARQRAMSRIGLIRPVDLVHRPTRRVTSSKRWFTLMTGGGLGADALRQLGHMLGQPGCGSAERQC